VVPWANGLGTTRVIARNPDDDTWAWRLSLADVVVDGRFSQLRGVARVIAVASGPGMDLTVDGIVTRLIASSPAFAFDGGATTSCALLDGPIVDLNLMLRDVSGWMQIEQVQSGDAVEVQTACVVLDGSIAIRNDVLVQFDAMIGPARAVALEPCRVALIQVT
jgi:environmental stress-induced protein Ves